MRVIPQTPLDWVLLTVAAATGVIISVALQDFGVAFAVIHFGGLVLLGSAGPRWAAAGITTGPFAVVRHPFYIAYSLAWMAARREERQLEAHFGDAYRAYRSKAGLLLPSIPALVRSFR